MIKYKTKMFSINVYQKPVTWGFYGDVERKDVDVIIYHDADDHKYLLAVRDHHSIDDIIWQELYCSEQDALNVYDEIDMNFVIKAYSDKQQYLHNNKTL